MSLMTNGFTTMPLISNVQLGPQGMTANPINVGIKQRIGAMVKMNLFAPAGTISSLKNSLMASANG